MDSKLEFDLTPRQRALYIQQLDHPANPFCTIGGFVHIRKEIGFNVVRKSHDIFSMQQNAFYLRLLHGDGAITAARQYYSKAPNLPLEIIDLSESSDPEVESSFLITQASQAIFDINGEVFFRSYLFILPEKFIYFCAGHHIFSDGMSFSILLRHFANICSDVYRGNAIENPQAPDAASYIELIENDIFYAQDPKYKKSEIHWVRQIENGWPRNFILPLRNIKADMKSQKFALSLTVDESNSIRTLAFESGLSEYQVLFAILVIYLFKAYNVETLTVGLESHNRRNKAARSTVGFFVNTFPVFIDKGALTFGDLLKNVKTSIFKSYRHQRFPINDLKNLILEREADVRRVFDVLFDYQIFELDRNNKTDIVDEVDVLFNGAMENPLRVSYWDFGATQPPQLVLDANSSYITSEEALLIQRRLVHLIKTVRLDSIIDNIDIIPLEERKKLLSQSCTWVEPNEDKLLLQFFLAEVKRQPLKTALISGDRSLSYADLDKASDYLAEKLISLGARANDIIAICMDRKAEMVVTMLAVIKSGSAYVNLDPTYPKDRLNFVLKDSCPRLLITERASCSGLMMDETETIYLDDCSLFEAQVSLEGKNSVNNRISKISQNDLAYVIYTSGSTGNPKGVMIEHGNLANFLISMKFQPGMDSENVLLAVSTFSFDISMLELYLPLVSGASIVLASDLIAKDPSELCRLIKSHNIDYMQATPSYWELLLSSGFKPQSRFKALCGGEAMSLSLVRKFLNIPQIELWNMYGPTETCIWSTASKIINEVYLGKPIRNTYCYVLDQSGGMLPFNIPGELCIAGSGVARGYWNQPEKTSELFVQNPYHTDDKNTRLYRTGDLVRRLPNGELDFLGRLDNQIKIRGYRIEPSEIEAKISELYWIGKTIVTEFDGNLAVYYTLRENSPQDGVDLLSVRRHLASTLPSFMVPRYYMKIEEFPSTPNGKVDRKKLPSPLLFKPRQTVRPAISGRELELVQLWSELLNIPCDYIGVDSDFFELGGDSIVSVRFIRKALGKGYSFTLAQLYAYPTIGKLLALTPILPSQSQVADEILHETITTRFTADQIGFLDRSEIIGAYTVDLIFNVTALNPDILDCAIKKLVRDNQSLRLSFIKEHEWVARITAPNSISFSSFAYHKISLEVLDDVCYLNQQFDEIRNELRLDNGPKCFFKLVEGPYKNQRLLFTISHLVCDRYGIELLLAQLFQAYELYENSSGFTPNLAPLDRYHEIVSDHFNLVNSDLYKSQLHYWNSLPWKRLKHIPQDYGNEPASHLNNLASSRVYVCRLSPACTQLLQKGLPDKLGISALELIIALLGRQLTLITGSSYQYIQIFDANREGEAAYADPSLTVFTAAVLRNLFLEFENSLDLSELVKDTKCRLDNIPFDGVGAIQLRHLAVDESIKSQAGSIPDPMIRLNYLGEPSQDLDFTKRGHTTSPLTSSIVKSTVEQVSRGVVIQLHWVIEDGQLVMVWEYSEALHRSSRIEKWANECRQNFEKWIQQLADINQTVVKDLAMVR